MQKVLGFLGMFLIVGMAYLFSTNKKDVNWKSAICAFLGQIILAVLLIKTPLWKLVELASKAIDWLVSQSTEGIKFVFGDLATTNGFILFFNGLLPIVFISGLMGVLFHFGIIQKFVSVVGVTGVAS